MKRIAGKTVLTELAELVDPAHTALVVIDMQRDFLDHDGTAGQLGADLAMYDDVRRHVATLIAAARAASVLVVHVHNTTLVGGVSDSPAQLRFTMIMQDSLGRAEPPVSYTVDGTRGHEPVPEAAPLPGEVIVQKHRSSAFWGTNLSLVLSSNAVATVVVAGCTTEGCVESTARDALFNDYYVVVAEDCVGSDDTAQHEASLLLMRHRFDMTIGSAISGMWSASRLRVLARGGTR